jgi:hypothetical protein
MKRLAIVIAFLLGVGIVAHGAEPPLPADLSIVPPDSALPQQLKSLSGKWATTWRYKNPRLSNDAVLVFEKITAEEASVVYAAEGLGTAPAGYGRHLVKLNREGDNVHFTLERARNRMEFQFIPSQDIIKCQTRGSLGGAGYATFKRR